MRRRDWLKTLALVGGSSEAQAQADSPPTLKNLGDGRVQIGAVVVDPAKHRFVLPGQVRVLGRPLEYLACSPTGVKAYESLLTLNATGTEFNLACILIGLERSDSQVRAHQYRRIPTLTGPRVQLHVSWLDGAQRRRLSAAEALFNAEAQYDPTAVQWIYVGSPASDGRNRFAADQTGSLIGFSHDASCVIEAAEPVGRGAYGMVRGNAALGAEGAAIELQVEAMPS